jgi:hypothetical protein
MSKQSTHTYADFLASKHIRPKRNGFSVDAVNPKLFDWQQTVVRWALKCGRAALWEDCGLGKSFQQLEWARHVVAKTGGKVLLLCPLAVGWQTIAESKKFGIECDVRAAASNDEVCGSGIFVTNYEKLHLFKPERFDGVVLDESSCLKNFTGKTKRMLCERFVDTPYKLACTATPAPNDRMELGNHSEFLGIMPSAEMLQRWFINDGGKAGSYRLRMHGEREFWRWMASWAVCISSPADIGFSDVGYRLPPLKVVEHVVESQAEDGYLFAVPREISATEVHQEKRANLSARADVVAQLVNGDRDTWAVWCDTDYEADALMARLTDAVEVRGSHSDKIKEERFRAFADGKIRVMVSKPGIAGHGLNWQHCHKTTWFAGYSYENFYQALRRLLRFGQLHEVECHLVRTTNEGSICEVINRKQRQHVEMQCEMAGEMSEGMREELGLGLKPVEYLPTVPMTIPAWLHTKGADV